MTKTHAVVLGGGLAGMYAASVLARHVDRITVIERDRFPEGPQPRKGVPQARHAHLLMAGGARAADKLLPGTIDRLLTAGAHRIGLPEDVVGLTAYGWQHRFPATQFMITCTRPLFDWIVREQALRDPGITVREATDVVGLLGGATRVTGASVRDRATGAMERLDADLVVNCTGRASTLNRWLAELGLPTVEEDVVDTGMAYATRIFQTPPGVRGKFPAVSVYADHRLSVPGRSGVVFPIEGGRWIVTLSGSRGGEPSIDEEGFHRFARELRDPIVADLIEAARPLTEVQGTRSTSNRRLRVEKLPFWPDGIITLGDALAAFNPVHGHGMSAAALGAIALDEELRRHGLEPGAANRAQRAISALTDNAWMLATSVDVWYPDCRIAVEDPRLAARSTEGRGFADLLGDAAVRDPAVSKALFAVNTLSAPLRSLESPDVVAALRRGPRYPALTRPPISTEELDRVSDDAAVVTD